MGPQTTWWRQLGKEAIFTSCRIGCLYEKSQSCMAVPSGSCTEPLYPIQSLLSICPCANRIMRTFPSQVLAPGPTQVFPHRKQAAWSVCSVCLPPGTSSLFAESIGHMESTAQELCSPHLGYVVFLDVEYGQLPATGCYYGDQPRLPNPVQPGNRAALERANCFPPARAFPCPLGIASRPGRKQPDLNLCFTFSRENRA